QGQLFVESDVPGASLIVKQDGNLVAVVDVDASPEVTLPAGTYHLELSPPSGGLALSAPEITVRLGGRQEVAIRSVVAPDPAPQVPVVHALRRFEGHKGPVRSVAFSRDGRYALSGSGWPKGDRTMRLWDVATGAELHCFRGHARDVLAVAFAPDGRR